MAYYTLAVRRDGVWSPEFGDPSRAVVQEELEGMVDGVHGYKRADLRIIKTAASQIAIDVEIAILNDKR